MKIPPELAERIKQGDEKAMTKFVELSYQEAFGTALRMLGIVEDAEDACQVAYLNFFKAIASFKGKASLSTWYYRILVNSATDIQRKRKIKEVPLDEKIAKWEGKDKDNPVNRILNDELSKEIQSALQSLSENQKQVFILKHFNDLKLDEIAKILGLSPGTVKSHLHRAVISLRSELKDYLEA